MIIKKTLYQTWNTLVCNHGSKIQNIDISSNMWDHEFEHRNVINMRKQHDYMAKFIIWGIYHEINGIWLEKNLQLKPEIF